MLLREFIEIHKLEIIPKFKLISKKLWIILKIFKNLILDIYGLKTKWYKVIKK